MLRINDILVDEAIADVPFACDLAACKGACCTMPGSRGAPLLDSEIDEITRWYPRIMHMLPAEHISAIERDGLYGGIPGDYATACVDDRACVFVFPENGVASCAFERAHQQGVIPWRKPLSCHLFPVRVRRQTPEFLEYESIPECVSGLRHGAERRTFLDQFLCESLTRAYGPEWVEQLQRVCARLRDLRDRSSLP
jgi:hypothetical protein